MDRLREAFFWLAAEIERAGLWWGLAITVVAAAGSLLAALAIVVSWPVDHFRASGRAGLWEGSHPVVRALGIAAKNLGGLVLVALGLVMALPGIPGQGVLTMIIGVTLVDFPGKRRLERRLIGRPWVLRKLNALRARFHRAPLILD
jgi:hypothetical protein